MANLKINEATRPKAKTTILAAANRVTVRNPLSPNHISTVDAGMYGAMKSALLKVLPRNSPGSAQVNCLKPSASCAIGSNPKDKEPDFCEESNSY